jgi:hypothetical protein
LEVKEVGIRRETMVKVEKVIADTEEAVTIPHSGMAETQKETGNL